MLAADRRGQFQAPYSNLGRRLRAGPHVRCPADFAECGVAAGLQALELSPASEFAFGLFAGAACALADAAFATLMTIMGSSS